MRRFRLVSRLGTHRRPAWFAFGLWLQAPVTFGWMVTGTQWVGAIAGMRDTGRVRRTRAQTGLARDGKAAAFMTGIGKETGIASTTTITGIATMIAITTGTAMIITIATITTGTKGV
jgi:hypothetical protein